MARSLVFTAALLCGLVAGSAPAAESSAKFSFKPLAVEGLVLRDRVVVGRDFAAKHKIEVAAPFAFKVPRVDGLLRVAKFPAELGQAYIKIVYGSADERFMESIQFARLRSTPGRSSSAGSGWLHFWKTPSGPRSPMARASARSTPCVVAGSAPSRPSS